MTLITPAVKQMCRSMECRILSRNKSRRNGTYDTKLKQAAAPPGTHHCAVFSEDRGLIYDH